MSAPCRVSIRAVMPNGVVKNVTIRNAGYGAYAHLVRWLNRGAVRVVVDVFSNSTGKLVGRAES